MKKKKKKPVFSLTVKATVEHVGRISSLKKMCLAADVSNMVYSIQLNSCLITISTQHHRKNVSEKMQESLVYLLH